MSAGPGPRGDLAVPARAALLAAGLVAGSVRSFDEDSGLGTLAATSGEGPLAGEPAGGLLDDAGSPGATAVRFHCTAISDGTRSIAVGAPVAFSVVLRHGGGLEAAVVLPLLSLRGGLEAIGAPLSGGPSRHGG